MHEYFGSGTYEVKIASSGEIIPISEGHTMLEALRMAGIDIPSSCEGGVCLDCKTRYLAGQPVHRDITLPRNQRSEYLTPCVSGCEGGRITLDI
ncbi:2Fe-2S iron-sulfur cluster-binding protein [Halomonas piscis]|uniref:2Fe-2S iron-sulfur cluster-binding protein n=1 Tax=Halomonas piscis TaxID=3031727 RepID=UPI0035E101F2